MTLEFLIEPILESLDELAGRLQRNEQPPALGLRRAARLPVLAALHKRLNVPILLLTDRADHTLALLDELSLWAPQALRLYFPEPTPMFYEKAAWGEASRRDRLMALYLTLDAYPEVAAVLRRSCAVQRPPGRRRLSHCLDRCFIRLAGGRWRSRSSRR